MENEVIGNESKFIRLTLLLSCSSPCCGSAHGCDLGKIFTSIKVLSKMFSFSSVESLRVSRNDFFWILKKFYVTSMTTSMMMDCLLWLQEAWYFLIPGAELNAKLNCKGTAAWGHSRHQRAFLTWKFFECKGFFEIISTAANEWKFSTRLISQFHFNKF